MVLCKEKSSQNLNVTATSSVHGISLLGMCPDNGNARIISKGGACFIQLMKAVMKQKGLAANLIDPVGHLLAKGDHLEAWVDVEASTQNFKANLFQKITHTYASFTAGNKKVSYLSRPQRFRLFCSCLSRVFTQSCEI